MGDQEIQGAVEEVIRAVEGLNRVFDKHARTLREAGENDKLREWLKGCLALRDSGDMYVSWARHYAKGAAGGSPPEEEGFPDEGADWDGPPQGRVP